MYRICLAQFNPFPQGKYETIACNEFTKIHHDVVRQVSFVESLNSFISASESIVTKSAYLPSVIIGNLDIQDSQIIFKMNSVSEVNRIYSERILLDTSSHPQQGTTCFAFDETSQTLATGELCEDENFEICCVERFERLAKVSRSAWPSSISSSTSLRLINFLFSRFDLFRALKIMQKEFHFV